MQLILILSIRSTTSATNTISVIGQCWNTSNSCLVKHLSIWNWIVWSANNQPQQQVVCAVTTSGIIYLTSKQYFRVRLFGQQQIPVFLHLAKQLNKHFNQEVCLAQTTKNNQQYGGLFDKITLNNKVLDYLVSKTTTTGWVVWCQASCLGPISANSKALNQAVDYLVKQYPTSNIFIRATSNKEA